jgi:hypothetical protein
MQKKYIFLVFYDGVKAREAAKRREKNNARKPKAKFL